MHRGEEREQAVLDREREVLRVHRLLQVLDQRVEVEGGKVEIRAGGVHAPLPRLARSAGHVEELPPNEGRQLIDIGVVEGPCEEWIGKAELDRAIDDPDDADEPAQPIEQRSGVRRRSAEQNITRARAAIRRMLFD